MGRLDPYLAEEEQGHHELDVGPVLGIDSRSELSLPLQDLSEGSEKSEQLSRSRLFHAGMVEEIWSRYLLDAQDLDEIEIDEVHGHVDEEAAFEHVERQQYDLHHRQDEHRDAEADGVSFAGLHH